MTGESKVKIFEKEIERLKKEARDTKWGLEKTNEGIKILYKDLEKKTQELRKFAETKSEFVSIVSHELRSPLTSIREGISQIEEGILGETTDEQKEFLKIALSDIDRLRRIVDNLLDISRIEAERVEVRRELVDIVGLVKDVEATFSPRAKDLGLDIITESSKDKIEIYIDKDKIAQVFTNLINNALKFTKKGHVAVSITDQKNKIQCAVSDTGIGISEEDLPKVFGKFQQFGSAAHSGEKGTGLGLSICQGIVELHHGDIQVESEVNEGTKFTITLPKFSVENIFQEYVHNGLKDAIKQNGALSVVVFEIKNIESVVGKMDKAKLSLMIHDLRRMTKATLRRKADVALEGTNSILMVLTAIEKKDALMLLARIQNCFNEYLSKEKMDKVIEVVSKIASFPSDGGSEEELLGKVGLSAGLTKDDNATKGRGEFKLQDKIMPSKSHEQQGDATVFRRDKERQDMLIFELNKKEREIQKLRTECEIKSEEVRKLDKLKSDFISTISHELRTPMTIVQEGVCQVLEGIHGEINQGQQEYLSMSLEGIGRLGYVINELLDISHLEAEKTFLQRQLVDIVDLVNKAVEAFMPQAKKKGFRINTCFSKDKIEIYLDVEKITQVFSKLIDNALKFAGQGDIDISVEDKENVLECSVADKGEGISKENLPKVFDKFQQFNRASGPGEKGTGLGLTICKGIAELHCGKISVHSKPNEGAKFIFTLPRLTVGDVFQEYIKSGIKDSIRFKESLSIVVFEIQNFNDVQKTLGGQAVEVILQDFMKLVKKNLRRKADLALKGVDTIFMMLPLTTKEDVPFVAKRMKQNFDQYLSKKQLTSKLRVAFSVATFPDDGSTDKELLRKVRRL